MENDIIFPGLFLDGTFACN